MTDDDPHLPLGAYVLGGLSSADRTHFEDHLATCDRCRQELAGAAGIPALLRLATPAPVVPLDPRGSAQVVARARAQHQRRWRIAATAVVATAAAAVAVVLALVGVRAPHTDATFTALNRAQVSGSAVFDEKPWGTAIELDLTDLPRTGTFVLVVHGRDGTVEEAATWSATAQPHSRVTAATSITGPNIAQMQVITTGATSNPVAQATPKR